MIEDPEMLAIVKKEEEEEAEDEESEADEDEDNRPVEGSAELADAEEGIATEAAALSLEDGESEQGAMGEDQPSSEPEEEEEVDPRTPQG